MGRGFLVPSIQSGDYLLSNRTFVKVSVNLAKFIKVFIIIIIK